MHMKLTGSCKESSSTPRRRLARRAPPPGTCEKKIRGSTSSSWPHLPRRTMKVACMDARNRSLNDWFSRVRSGQLRLPRFQRFEAWSHNEVAALVETVIRGLPSGATLILEIGDTEPFVSRALETAPVTRERVSEHLLDGQQRLTALWRALHDNYPDRTYLVRFEEDEQLGTQLPKVLAQNRWNRKGTRYPVWCDSPASTWERGYIPLRLLNVDDTADVRDWARQACGRDPDLVWDISDKIAKLSAAIKSYNVPFLSLPPATPKDVALDVFIKMNTSSVRLSAFDIVVAQLEEAVGQSLHDLVDDLRAQVPSLHRYAEAGTLALDVAALRSDRPSGQQSYQKLDLRKVGSEWEELVRGIRWAIEFLESERVFDAQRLPSVVVLPVLAAIHEFIPEKLDAAGNARQLVRAYLWRSFLTRRYDQSASSRAFQDYRGLKSLLTGLSTDRAAAAPVFDEEVTPLPVEQDLISAGWPRSREVIARGILAVSLRQGARDIADDRTVTAEQLASREYHHLFPDSLLVNAGLESWKSMRALNCALITWSTNRTISNKPPLQYLEERTSKANLGESEIRSRLASHIVPYSELASAGPYGELDADQVAKDYERFLWTRAKMMMPVILTLCDGGQP
ncbi:GmrSD restriction endonuclease domain-containing protein [Pseudarthrobacter oxydans]|uniref:GmrSD restriction endonuclease domain-containing protein n=1 Tax=Pseudarthrobacter oxydans TaxID=1671 RepID=UPI00381B009A